MKKRILAMCLVIIMLISLLPVSTICALADSSNGAGNRVIEGGQRDFLWPVASSSSISSCFLDLMGHSSSHSAIDICAAHYATVRASYPGTVVAVVNSCTDDAPIGNGKSSGSGFGNYVVLQHSYTRLNGSKITLYSRYSHLASASVSSGSYVSAGQKIGEIGSTGSSYGYHLDFQICYGGWSPYQTYSIDPYVNDLLELPSGLNANGADSWCTCCYNYVTYVKQLYSKPLLCIVTFNPNGGNCSISSKSVTYGGSISSLPTATRTGYTFDGWYTAASGGTKITTSTTFSSNTTVYAHWTVNKANVNLYGADGGAWKSSSESIGSTYTLPADYPKANNAYFSGWSYTNGALTYDLRPGDKVTVNGAISLYPVFISHEKAISGEEVYIYNISDFTDEDYDINEVTHTKETKIDKSYWSNWSAYSMTPVTASSTVEVRTTPMYRYYYFRCPYCGAHEPFYGTSDCGKQIPESAWTVMWSTTPYSQSNYKSFSYTSAKYYTISLGDGQLWCFSSGNVNKTAIGTIDSAGDGVVIDRGYSYRTYIEKYDTIIDTVTAYKITPSGCRHDYMSEHFAATCTTPEYTVYTCKICGESYVEYPGDVYGEWSTEKPKDIDESLIETKTQYRSSNYETKTSYNTKETGWTQISSTWEKSSSGAVEYVSSWPSGFSTSHSLYSQYNKSPKSSSETDTTKTVIDSNNVCGYIYWHWCRDNQNAYLESMNRLIKPNYSSEFKGFHAFYSTTSPSQLIAQGHRYDTSDNSYDYENQSCCRDSSWYYPLEVHRQTYSTYKKLFTHERWTDWSAWSDEPIVETDNRKVETQPLYRYVNPELGQHDWDEGTVTTPASCTAPGLKTFTCKVCGETHTEKTDVLDHEFENGKCIHCNTPDPDFPVRITIADESTFAGSSVTVPVYIYDNTGFAGFTFEILYNDSVMTLTDIRKGDVLQTSESGMLVKNIEGNTVNYTDCVNICSDGVLFYLTFDIKESAKAGYYDVRIALKDNKDSNLVNENSASVRMDALQGKIAIATCSLTFEAAGGANAPQGETNANGDEIAIPETVPVRSGYTFMGWASALNLSEEVIFALANGETCDVTADYQPGDLYLLTATDTLFAVWKAVQSDSNAPQMVFDNKTARAGETVKVAITLKNADALKSIALSGFYYDTDSLELVSGEWKLQDSALSDVNLDRNVAAIGFKENIDCNAIIFELTFKVKDGVADGSYPISCNITANRTVGDDELPYSFTVVSGSIQVISIIKGDVDGNGKVTSDDAIYLLYHTLLPSMYPINQSADFDGNGKVTSDDAIYLLYHTLLPGMYPLK